MASYEQGSCRNSHDRGTDPGRLGMVLIVRRSLRHLGVVLLHSQPLPSLHFGEVSTEYLELSPQPHRGEPEITPTSPNLQVVGNDPKIKIQDLNREKKQKTHKMSACEITHFVATLRE
jgi:hypothetical protein